MNTKRAISLLVNLLCFYLLAGSSCHVVRYVWWNYADINDYKKFPANPISSSAKPKAFNVPTSPVKQVIFSAKDYNTQDFEQFLEHHKTVAFLVIRNDSMIYEKYFDGFTRESIYPAFSVAKSFVSALVGIAIAEGKIRSVDQPITDFLPELKDPRFRNVTLKHLLEMRSGISFVEGYGNPFGTMAKFYYGLDLKKYTLALKIKDNPDKYYKSANTQLLAMALERVTGKTLSEYFEEKIWQPMGAEFPASWSIDSRSDRQIKAFCCINARAIDFAKFGQLYLDHGKTGKDTIIPPSWVSESLTIRTDSRDSEGFPYAYHWRVTKEGDFFAKGILGQYIYVCPEKKVVIVRFGKKSADISWARFFKEFSRSL
jgi:CubicO group peptidase (beta-lactamase class C family)